MALGLNNTRQNWLLLLLLLPSVAHGSPAPTKLQPPNSKLGVKAVRRAFRRRTRSVTHKEEVGSAGEEELFQLIKKFFFFTRFFYPPHSIYFFQIFFYSSGTHTGLCDWLSLDGGKSGMRVRKWKRRKKAQEGWARVTFSWRHSQDTYVDGVLCGWGSRWVLMKNRNKATPLRLCPHTQP